ncbi:hypothetical protein ACLQ3K_00600 [Tsukamurella sp. DT100]|uniref:hypothetical protein n=1 Tax=Tsukamurella sp. DT100 TaxID=3393415 RepID=UPI003CF1263A
MSRRGRGARNQRRDRLGRFAGSGSKIAGGAKSARRAASAASKSSARKAGRSVGNAYVRGSFEKHLVVGQGGAYRGAKVGAEFKTPKGRGVLVKGIVGYHGKPNRKIDIEPSLDKAQRKLTVSAKPGPGFRKTTGRKVRR